MGCLQCGEQLDHPAKWTCDKCTEKAIAVWDNLLDKEKKSLLQKK